MIAKRSPLKPARLVGFLFAALLVTGCAPPPPAGLVALQRLTTDERPFDRVEFAFHLPGFTGNPFDPAELDVTGEFLGPDGKMLVVPAFWHQPFNRAVSNGVEVLTRAGEPHWRLRFAANAAGDWRVRVQARDATGRTAAHEARFTVAAPDQPRSGFVRVHANRRNFATDDGRPYVPVGLNVCWFTSMERGTQDYEEWFARLQEQGGNYARVWLARWRSLGLWWQDTGTTNYTARLDRAFLMDRILELAEQHDIRLLPTLLIHRQFRTGPNGEWAGSPYNVTNGGYLEKPEEVWTSARATRDLKNYFRYCVARWGYSTHILGWELWNEVGWTDHYDQHCGRVSQWHGEMTCHLKSVDAFGHPVTTSSSKPIDETLFATPELDFITLHDYWDGPQWQKKITSLTQRTLRDYGRPVLFAELGYEWRTGELSAERDPGGLHYHLGLWAGLMTGGAGTGMGWWWQNHFFPGGHDRWLRPVRAFADAVPWLDKDLRPATTNDVTASAARLEAHGYVSPRGAWLWLTDPQFGPADPKPVPHRGIRLSVKLPAGDYTATWIHTDTGAVVARQSAPAATGPLVLDAPAFTNDIALRLVRATTP